MLKLAFFNSCDFPSSSLGWTTAAATSGLARFLISGLKSPDGTIRLIKIEICKNEVQVRVTFLYLSIWIDVTDGLVERATSVPMSVLHLVSDKGLTLIWNFTSSHYLYAEACNIAILSMEWMLPLWILVWDQYSMLLKYEILKKLVTFIAPCCTRCFWNSHFILVYGILSFLFFLILIKTILWYFLHCWKYTTSNPYLDSSLIPFYHLWSGCFYYKSEFLGFLSSEEFNFSKRLGRNGPFIILELYFQLIQQGNIMSRC